MKKEKFKNAAKLRLNKKTITVLINNTEMENVLGGDHINHSAPGASVVNCWPTARCEFKSILKACLSYQNCPKTTK